MSGFPQGLFSFEILKQVQNDTNIGFEVGLCKIVYNYQKFYFLKILLFDEENLTFD